jgi:hypothetical protein
MPTVRRTHGLNEPHPKDREDPAADEGEGSYKSDEPACPEKSDEYGDDDTRKARGGRSKGVGTKTRDVRVVSPPRTSGSV